MSYVRLAKRSYFRRFEDIGYVFNEISHNDIVLDECGAIFLSEIGREPRQLQAAAKSIASKFADANQEEVQRDFCEFVSQLETGGFITTGQTLSELDEKEPVFSYSRVESTPLVSESLEARQLPSSEVLNKHFWKHPRLFNMQIELTSYCNLRCVHCYLGDAHAAAWMSKDKVFDLLDQLNAMGTLEITFTSGEALSRPDLPDILRHARRNDLSLTLLTNNTLLTNTLLEEIKNTGVRLIQISVYSMKPEVHDAITRHPGSLKETVRNIEKLVAENVPVQIACPVMKENLESFSEVIEWGKNMRFRVKPDLMIMARTDFSKDNLGHRLNLDESRKALKIIIASDEDYHRILTLKDRTKEKRNPADPVCGVGTSTMCLAANGDFYPCPGFQMTLGNFNNSCVEDVWSNSKPLMELRKVKNSAYSKCLECQSLEYCHICMAKFYNESGGDIYKVSDHFCGVSHLNRELAQEQLTQQSR
jgi:radical SAM protein with 4Fe4S-binding SPASM domain